MDGSLDTEFLQTVKARLLNEYPRQVRACLQALGDEDIWWRPNEQSNAVGNLVLHVSASNRYYLEHVIGGGVDVRDRDAEFAARGTLSKADLERVWSDTESRVSRVMETISPERLV